MSQIHNVNTSQVQFQQDQLNTRPVEQDRSSALNNVVQNAEAGSPQAPQVHRSVAGIVGRVALGVVTLGISEAVIAIADKICGSHDQAPATMAEIRGQNLEQAPAEMDAPQLSEAVQDKTLPPEYQAAMKRAEKAVRDAVGVELPDDMMEVKLSSGKTVVEAFTEAVGKEKGELSAATLHRIAVKVMCGCKEVRDAAIAKFGPSFDPGFAAKYAGQIATAMALYHVQEGSAEHQKIMDMFKGMQEGGKLLDSAAQRMSEKTGMNADDVRSALNMDQLVDAFTRETVRIANILLFGPDELPDIPSQEAVMQRYEAKMDEILDKRVALFDKVDELGFNDATKARFKTDILKNVALKDAEIFTVAKEIAPHVDSRNLVYALQNPNEFTLEEIGGLVLSMAIQYSEAAASNEGLKKMDVVQRDFVGVKAIQIVLGQTEGLAELYGKTSPEFRKALFQHLQQSASEKKAISDDFDQSEGREIVLNDMVHAERALWIGIDLAEMLGEEELENMYRG